MILNKSETATPAGTPPTDPILSAPPPAAPPLPPSYLSAPAPHQKVQLLQKQFVMRVGNPKVHGLQLQAYPGAGAKGREGGRRDWGGEGRGGVGTGGEGSRVAYLIIVIVVWNSRVEMDFFLGLLSCGRDKRSSRAPLCLPRFCLFRNQKHRPNAENPKDHTDPRPLKTASMTSRPLSQIHPAPLNVLPQTQLLRLHNSVSLSGKRAEWGFLVGVVQADRCDLELLGRDCLPVGVGSNEEINSVGALRRASLDHLVVFWKELAADFSLSELLLARQPLSLVFEDWKTLVGVAAACEEELLKKLGEFCLKESESRICFNIITLENKYVLQFQPPPVFRQHLAELIRQRAAVALEPPRFELLLEKMALRDYLELKQGSNEADRKLQHFLREIEREVAELSRRKDEVEAQTFEMEDTLKSEPQAKSQSLRKSSNDYVELEAQYFAARRGAAERSAEAEAVDEMLEIYYFNNQSNDESIPEPHRSPRKLNNFQRKVRSRSEDATYVPDDCLDDEFFDRY